MSKREVPENFMQDFLSGKPTDKQPTSADNVSESPTMSDNVSDQLTMSDNVRQSPTIADSLELVQMTVRIDKRHRDRLQAMANNEGRLLSDVVREAIREYLRRR